MSDYNLFPNIPPWMFVVAIILMIVGAVTIFVGIIWLLVEHVRIV